MGAQDSSRVLERLEQKIDRLDQRLASMEIVQAEQAKDIHHHIARTDAAEERIEQVARELEPLKASALAWSYVGKGLSALGVLVGIGTALWKVLR